MSRSIKITPSFLISLMSMARKHDPDHLISVLNLEKSSILTQEDLNKFAEETTGVGFVGRTPNEPDPKPDPPESDIPLSFFKNGPEVLGFIKNFVDERPNLHIDPSDLMYLVTTYFTGVNDGNQISYQDLMGELLSQASDAEEIMMPGPSPESNRSQMEETQRQMGLPVGEKTGPYPTEEELQNLPTRGE